MVSFLGEGGRRLRKSGALKTIHLFSINQESHNQQVHVLAVDDSLVDRKVIERLLKITSCKVTAVDSGRKALQFLGLEEEKNSTDGFEGLKVDLIITDYCMPGMTGFELLKKIKGSSAFRQVPVVIMSSENVLARIDRCLEEGAEDFIVKPVKLSDVKRLKESMFGNQKMNINPQEDTPSKRKLHPVTTTPSSSVPSSPPPLLSSSSSKFSSSPPPPPPLRNIPRPFSPTTTLESPTRRIRLSN